MHIPIQQKSYFHSSSRQCYICSISVMCYVWPPALCDITEFHTVPAAASVSGYFQLGILAREHECRERCSSANNDWSSRISDSVLGTQMNVQTQNKYTRTLRLDTLWLKLETSDLHADNSHFSSRDG